MKKLIMFGLLILLSASCMFGQNKVMDADSGFFIYLNGSKTKLTEDDYLLYAKGFEKDNYYKYHNDEFEWHDQFQIMKENFNKKIAEADFASTYVLVLNMEVGDYDFTNEGFPISIGESTFIPLGHPKGYYEATGDSVFNNKIALKLDSLHKYNFFNYAKEDAKT